MQGDVNVTLITLQILVIAIFAGIVGSILGLGGGIIIHQH